MQEIFPQVFVREQGRRRQLCTRNLVPGKKAHQEFLIQHNGVEYREWNPKRSKLGAAIVKGLKLPPLGTSILYLGAASGNTVSYLSDIVGPEAMIYAVEFSPTVMRQLVYLADVRPNIAPILADAGKPKVYLNQVLQADFIFQDVAQRDQVEFFLRNIELLLKPGGYALLALKARSIDVTAHPRVLFMQAKKQLSERVIVHSMIPLEPFERDHVLFVCQRK